MAQENKSKVSILTNGIIKENPVLRLVLGTCSVLAVTTSVSSRAGHGCSFHLRAGVLQHSDLAAAQRDPR